MADFLNIYLLVSNIAYLSVLIGIVSVGQILLRLKDRKRTLPQKWPTVSVIVSAKNEAAVIADCIQSLLNLDYPKEKLDIWMVDDCSSDETAQIMASFQKKHSHLHVLSTADFKTHLKAKAKGIAWGAKHARGEWFFITDADSTVHPLWIKEMLRGIDEHTGTIAGMMTVDEHGLLSAVEKMSWGYTNPFAFGASGYGVEFVSVGPNTAILRKAYEEAGGLENANFRVAEDLALFNMVIQQGYKALAHNNLETTVRMKPVSSVVQLFSQQRRWIKGPFEQPWYYQIGVFVLFGFSFFYQLAIMAALFLAPQAALWALLSRLVAEGTVIATEKFMIEEKRILRYMPILFLYLFFIFIFLPLSFIFWRSVSWRGEGYKIDYN